jgi:hypothetical protein
MGTGTKELIKACLCCNKDFPIQDEKFNRKKFCSDLCRTKHWKRINREYYKERRKKEPERAGEKVIHNKKCRECSKMFTTTRKAQVYCDLDCSRKFRSRKRERERDKRIRDNGPIDHDISIERLMIRDKEICHLCDERVDIHSHHNDNYYPSIDHVIPIIRGGTHTWDNVRLAHRVCNSIKNNRTI